MIALTPFQAPMLIFRGDPKCRRTVVITLIDSPLGGNANVWFSSSKSNLANGHDSIAFRVGRSPYFSVGIQLVDFSGATTRLILPDVSSDIYAFATNYDAAIVSPSKPAQANPLGVMVICVEAF